MKYRVFLVLLLVAQLFIFSCKEDANQQFECITSTDCSGELICVEHQCVEQLEQSDNDDVTDSAGDEDHSTIIIPDEDNGNPDESTDNDTRLDDDFSVLDEDEIIDSDFIVDMDSVSDEDSVDIDFAVDEDVLIDSDSTSDEDVDIDVDSAVAICGNGIVEGIEACDDPDGNSGEYDGCKADCTLAAHCGDGTTDNPDEKCDSGANNGKYAYCNITCDGPAERCGDEILNGPGPEPCDDGPLNGHYGHCNAFCTGFGIRCGDGSIQAWEGEACDEGEDNGLGTCEYGSTTACTVCSSECLEEAGTAIYCGDNTINGSENCDDGGDNGLYDCCASDCNGPGLRCGDDIVNGAEACDDGNAIEDDYCDDTCEVIGSCGDGTTQSNEDCDEGSFCDNDNSIDCTDNASLCGAGNCITILKNGCNPSCSTDFEPPTVDSVDPVNGKSDVMDTIIVVTFSETMDYHDAKITLLKEGDTIPTEYAPREHTNLDSFTYSTTLDFSRDYDYTATVLATATDSGGNELGMGFVWTFSVDEDECLTENGGCAHICANTASGYECSCDAGYALEPDMMSCADIDECDDGLDSCDHTNGSCTNSEPGFTCSCDSGYRLQGDGYTCLNIDECFEESANCDPAHGSCTDNSGGFDCDCNAYYTGDGIACSLCDSSVKCEADCQPCPGEQVCKTNTNGTTQCIECVISDDCDSGYECISNSCVDIDECATGADTCDDYATCTDTEGSFTCACNSYYIGNGYSCSFCNTDGQCESTCHACGGSTTVCKNNGDSTTTCVECTETLDCNSGYECKVDNSCDDINECTAATHNCNLTYYTCRNTTGSFACDDINECASGNGGCDSHATCTNNVGAAPTCSCNNYYTGSGTSCTYCNADGQCGSGCTACGVGTPKCKDNGSTTQCVECLNDADCSGTDSCQADGSCGSCPSGWAENSGHCYYFSTDSKTHSAAQTYCAGFGGNIVTINSASEDSYIAGQTSQYTWIGLSPSAPKTSVSTATLVSPKTTGTYGGRYTGNTSDSALFRHAEIYKIVAGKTGYYDITVDPNTSNFDPQIRVFTSATTDALGASAFALQDGAGDNQTEYLTVSLTGGTTYYIGVTHENESQPGGNPGNYDIFINYSGNSDSYMQELGWMSGEDYSYENWFGTNPNEASTNCAFMYGGDEWDEAACTDSYRYVCEK
ncbi:Ig-like domain-containing protein [bacterium]|nr:Ig-like domain-containing protein [bacterium]